MKRRLVLTAGLLLLAGCATRPASPQTAGVVGPQLSVERFLQAVNARDFDGMARVFGTKDGPLADTGSSFGCFWKKIGSAFGGESCQKWQEVELRMNAISEILRHSDYQIVSEGRVAGRERSVTRIGVDMTLPPGRQARDVGFVVVVAGAGWMIEQIELVKATAATD